MKIGQLLNAKVSCIIASLGHGDSLCIADAGLPIAQTTEKIDLALCPGVPSFIESLKTVLYELKVESVLMAKEFVKISPELHSKTLEVLENYSKKICNKISIKYISHKKFKKESEQARGVIRTGEFTPFANILLFSGVVF